MRETAGWLANSAALVLLACSTSDPEAARGRSTRSEEPAPPVIQLLRQLRPNRVQPPEDKKDDWPEQARPSRIVRRALRPHIARVALEEKTGVVSERKSLFGLAGTVFRFQVTLDGPASLRFGIGSPGRVSSDRPVRFVVRVGGPGRSRVVFEREVREPGWIDIAVPLPASPGEIVALRLESSAEDAGAWAAWSSPEIAFSNRPPRAPGDLDVLLVSLDTLRADRLGCYGYDRPTSPFLDRLAADSFRFATTVSAAPWTLPAHRALFTGLYPTSRAGRSTRPLADVLWRSGYRTEAWTGGGAVDFRMGFGRGFDSYRVEDWIRHPNRLVEALTHGGSHKRFVFLHTYEPHDPYIHTEFAASLPSGRLDGYFDHQMWIDFGKTLTADERRYIAALYDGDVAYTDRRLGELFAELDASGTLEYTIVVVTSDHGEQFWEHGSWRHGQNLYDEQILVPLILYLPSRLRATLGIEGVGVIEQQVRMIDVYPTLLDLLGISVDKSPQGRSLVPLLRGEMLPPVEALAEGLNVSNTESKAIRTRGHKFIRSRAVGPGTDATAFIDELFELGPDPRELNDLRRERHELAAELARQLEALTSGAWTKGDTPLDQRELDPSLEQQLRALGYLGS